MTDNKLKVAVCLVTYNQERYIAQALESALSQQTDFPVDIIVGNDASTDGTLAVLEKYQAEYSNIVVLTNEHNRGVVRNTVNVFRYIFSHNYAYVAMLDGDDWWCDAEKLQLQVEFMETHPTYSMVYTRGGSFGEQSKNFFHSQSKAMPEGDLFPTLRTNYPMLNGTILHRTAFLQTIDWDELVACNLLYFDYPTNVMMAAQGPVGYIDRETLIWRRGIGSVSAPKDIAKALRHADSQAAQGLFLKHKFPNTAYDMPLSHYEEYRQQLYYTYGMEHKNYEVVHQAVHHPDFPKEAMAHTLPLNIYLDNKVMFNIYIYI